MINENIAANHHSTRLPLDMPSQVKIISTWLLHNYVSTLLISA